MRKDCPAMKNNLLKNQGENVWHKFEHQKPILDEIDKRIVSFLQQNGRMSNVELAKQVGLSPPPCLRRLRGLENEGVIAGYRAIINYKRLGYEVNAVIVVSLLSQRFEIGKRFLETMKRVNSVVDVKTTIEGLDFILFFISKNLDDYASFLKVYVKNNENVKSFKAYILSN